MVNFINTGPSFTRAATASVLSNFGLVGQAAASTILDPSSQGRFGRSFARNLAIGAAYRVGLPILGDILSQSAVREFSPNSVKIQDEPVKFTRIDRKTDIYVQLERVDKKLTGSINRFRDSVNKSNLTFYKQLDEHRKGFEKVQRRFTQIEGQLNQLQRSQNDVSRWNFRNAPQQPSLLNLPTANQIARPEKEEPIAHALTNLMLINPMKRGGAAGARLVSAMTPVVAAMPLAKMFGLGAAGAAVGTFGYLLYSLWKNREVIMDFAGIATKWLQKEGKELIEKKFLEGKKYLDDAADRARKELDAFVEKKINEGIEALKNYKGIARPYSPDPRLPKSSWDKRLEQFERRKRKQDFLPAPKDNIDRPTVPSPTFPKSSWDRRLEQFDQQKKRNQDFLPGPRSENEEDPETNAKKLSAPSLFDETPTIPKAIQARIEPNKSVLDDERRFPTVYGQKGMFDAEKPASTDEILKRAEQQINDYLVKLQKERAATTEISRPNTAPSSTKDGILKGRNVLIEAFDTITLKAQKIVVQKISGETKDLLGRTGTTSQQLKAGDLDMDGAYKSPSITGGPNGPSIPGTSPGTGYTPGGPSYNPIPNAPGGRPGRYMPGQIGPDRPMPSVPGMPQLGPEYSPFFQRPPTLGPDGKPIDPVIERYNTPNQQKGPQQLPFRQPDMPGVSVQGQPSGDGGGIDRSRFLAEIEKNPALLERMASMVKGEIGGQKAPLEKQIIQLETLFNRSQIRGHSLEQGLWSTATHGNRGYYPPQTFRRVSPEEVEWFKKNVYDPVMKGSDYSTRFLGVPATGNASGSYAAGRLARGMYGAGKWYGDEMYVLDVGDKGRLARNPLARLPMEGGQEKYAIKQIPERPAIMNWMAYNPKLSSGQQPDLITSQEIQNRGLMSTFKGDQFGGMENQPRSYQGGRGAKGEFNWSTSPEGIREFGQPGNVPLQPLKLPSGVNVNVHRDRYDAISGFVKDIEQRGYKFYKDETGANAFRHSYLGSRPSTHMTGTTIDINPKRNWINTGKTDMPPNMEKLGWLYRLSWGGKFGDAMHFETMSKELHKQRLDQLVREGFITKDVAQYALENGKPPPGYNAPSQPMFAGQPKPTMEDLYQQYEKETGEKPVLYGIAGAKETEAFTKWKDSRPSQPQSPGIIVDGAKDSSQIPKSIQDWANEITGQKSTPKPELPNDYAYRGKLVDVEKWADPRIESQLMTLRKAFGMEKTPEQKQKSPLSHFPYPEDASMNKPLEDDPRIKPEELVPKEVEKSLIEGPKVDGDITDNSQKEKDSAIDAKEQADDTSRVDLPRHDPEKEDQREAQDNGYGANNKGNIHNAE